MTLARIEPDWTRQQIALAVNGPDPVMWVSGRVRNGMGIAHAVVQEPGPGLTWNLTHLGSGCSIMRMQGPWSVVAPWARQVADLTDWSLFTLVMGWQQTDPDLHWRLKVLVAQMPAEIVSTQAGGGNGTDEHAKMVAAATEARGG